MLVMNNCQQELINLDFACGNFRRWPGFFWINFRRFHEKPRNLLTFIYAKIYLREVYEKCVMVIEFPGTFEFSLSCVRMWWLIFA